MYCMKKSQKPCRTAAWRRRRPFLGFETRLADSGWGTMPRPCGREVDPIVSADGLAFRRCPIFPPMSPCGRTPSVQAGQAGAEPAWRSFIARGAPGWGLNAHRGCTACDVLKRTFHAESYASWVVKPIVHPFECSTGLAHVHGHIQDRLRSLGSVGLEELATFDAHGSSILGQAGEVGPDVRRPTAGLEVPDPPHRTGIGRREPRGRADQPRPGSEAVGRRSARPAWGVGDDGRLLTVAPRLGTESRPQQAARPRSLQAR
jgi:hypothetical protein